MRKLSRGIPIKKNIFKSLYSKILSFNQYFTTNGDAETNTVVLKNWAF